jgi:hypothetical protein
MYQAEETYYLAIDPGQGGGFAYGCFTNKGGSVIICGKNSELEKLTINKQTKVIVERVPPYVGKFIPSSAAFKLGYSYGWIVGRFANYKTHLVTPQVWQAYLNIGTKGEQTTTQWKNKLKDEAIKLFPNQKRITLATADAYLLLHYALKNKLS